METTFVCPTCHALHSEPAEAAFVLSVLCLDCEMQVRYFVVMTSVPDFKAAA